MKILMVLTSHAELGNTGQKTGFWLEEFAAPYYAFLDAGAEVTLASPMGGQPPIDPKSDARDAQTNATRRFKLDVQGVAKLANTKKLKSVAAAEFDGVFYPGGHGPLWDLVNDAQSIQLIEQTMTAGKTVAVVCHAPAVLRDVKNADGSSVVRDKKVTGFSNSEETAAGLTEVVPFSLQDMLTAKGAVYSKVGNWQPYVITDGLLITGQNPASSESAAIALVSATRHRLNNSRVSASKR